MAKSKYAQRMGIRARKVGSETQKNLGACGRVLLKETRGAYIEEVEERTPRPLTHRLLRSIVLRFAGRSAIVGNDLSIAPYARSRRNATGTGHYKGRTWKKDTEWNVTGWQRAWPQLQQLSRGMHRRIIGGN
jgi:hypothetical protein